MEPVSIPSYIDDPPHFLLWSADEMAPILLGLARIFHQNHFTDSKTALEC